MVWRDGHLATKFGLNPVDPFPERQRTADDNGGRLTPTFTLLVHSGSWLIRKLIDVVKEGAYAWLPVP